MKFRYIKVILFLISVQSVYSQQLAQYTQFMYNTGLINPSYVIDEPGIVQVGSVYRKQWLGAAGAISPVLGNVFGNIPFDENLELKINYLNDKDGNGVLSKDFLTSDLAYKLPLNESLKLSFGFRLGVGNISLNFSKLNIVSDPSFRNSNSIVFNTGFGTFLYHDQFYVGLSVPNFYQSEDVNNIYENKSHIFLTGGYVWQASDMLKVKPAVLLKYVTGVPLSYDVATNFLFHDVFELGVAYRKESSVSFLASFQITRDLKLGSAYDFSLGELSRLNSGSIEFFITYEFDVLGLNKTYKSARFY